MLLYHLANSGQVEQELWERALLANVRACFARDVQKVKTFREQGSLLQ